jgi:hypothetical protein
MNALAKAVQDNAGKRYGALSKRTKQRNRWKATDRAKQRPQRRRIMRRKASRGKMWTAKGSEFNKMYPESEMRLYLCESVRKRLYELDCAEYEAKHGK